MEPLGLSVKLLSKQKDSGKYIAHPLFDISIEGINKRFVKPLGLLGLNAGLLRRQEAEWHESRVNGS